LGREISKKKNSKLAAKLGREISKNKKIQIGKRNKKK
jgi:hypothetical protein